MTIEDYSPTPYPEVNALLEQLLAGVREVLGSHMIGMYLDGSLASGDFDQDSDIDFVVVTDQPVSNTQFLALQLMHDRLAKQESVWAIQLEGSYISTTAIRRHDPAQVDYPNIERGPGEPLKLVKHDPTWNIHRSILRERGITLIGPDPKTLVDPLSADDLRQTMGEFLQSWAAYFLDNPDIIKARGYQSYVVLTVCRILYTLQHGEVVSKPVALRWAQQYLDARWAPLLQSAWIGRHHPDMPADPGEIGETLEFVRHAQAKIRK